MIPCIESGISGFDKLTHSEGGTGRIPENTATLIYGPVKTGKSIFCNQFAYQGLLNGEPCLFITTDHGIKQLETNMMEFQWPIEKYLEDKSVYIIDTISDISEENPIESENIISSHVKNPTDIMVKVGSGVIISTKIIQDSGRC